MAKQTPAEVYLQVACAVARGLSDKVGKGDHQADARVARQIRAAAKAIHKEIAEEMVLLSKTQTELVPLKG